MYKAVGTLTDYNHMVWVFNMVTHELLHELLTKEHFTVTVNPAMRQFSIRLSAILKEQNLSFEALKATSNDHLFNYRNRLYN